MAIEHGRRLVGIVDSVQLTADCCSTRLCAEEIQIFSAIASQRRRDEWLAGRIAAKYVFLQAGIAADGPCSGLYVQQISRAELAGFDERMYRSVIVSKDKTPGGGPARVGWEGSADTVPVAISHVNGLACAFIGGSGEVYAVDLEARAPRVAAFYVHNFTPRERSWAITCAQSFQLDPDWLYTLLWSAKECLLKTPQFATLSLWSMPSLEINVVAGSERLKNVHDAPGFTGTFEFLQADLAPSAKHIQLAVSGTADLILTAITRLD